MFVGGDEVGECWTRSARWRRQNNRCAVVVENFIEIPRMGEKSLKMLLPHHWKSETYLYKTNVSDDTEFYVQPCPNDAVKSIVHVVNYYSDSTF